MSGSPSTIPALKANLQAALQARVNLNDVQTTYGAPTPNPSREFIWLANVRNWNSEYAAIGAKRKEESYDLDVLIDVTREGQNQQAATERAFALLAELEALVISDVTVGGAVRLATVVANSGSVEELTSDTARGCRLTVAVHCEHRI